MPLHDTAVFPFCGQALETLYIFKENNASISFLWKKNNLQMIIHLQNIHLHKVVKQTLLIYFQI